MVARLSVRACIALALLVASAQPALADEDLIARARSEIDSLDYAAARTSLDRALATGKNRAPQLVEIYKLMGIVTGGFGDSEASVRSFKHMLALSPTATPEAQSPKITRPFQAAREFFASNEPLRVRAETSAEPPSVSLIIDSDPLAMVTGARVHVSVDGRPEEALSASGVSPIVIALPSGEKLRVRIAAVDLFGNELSAVDGLSIEREVDEVAPPPPPPAPVTSASRPLYAKWWL